MRKKVDLDKVLESCKEEAYLKQYEYICRLVAEAKLAPIKAAPLNGKRPALHTKYWLNSNEPSVDTNKYEEELRFATYPLIAVDYYLKHLDVYAKERVFVRRLSEYLALKQGHVEPQVSLNERCFDIWGQEKFLTLGSGKTVLQHCALDEAVLNFYSTSEPFAYYTRNRKTPQKILILENKDTFFSMRKYLLEDTISSATIFGENIDTLIYGAGKRALAYFKEFASSAEPYMECKANTFLYFGDLDYEGIGIYEQLAQSFLQKAQIIPFVAAYEAMLKKASAAVSLPLTKEQQNKNITGLFYHYFDVNTVLRMKKILDENHYIPQEILNVTDFSVKIDSVSNQPTGLL